MFYQWFEELKQIAVNDYGFTEEFVNNPYLFDPDGYKQYFDNGYTAENAIAEDMSYCDP